VRDELTEIRDRFAGFAHFVPSPLYGRLSGGVAEDPEVTSLLLEAREGQRWPMLLLAAVNLETRRAGEPFPQTPEALRAYVLDHREQLLPTIRTRSTQTNEVARCAYLRPCFAAAADGRPLAMIEVGASRGLVLNWDRYRYDYGDGIHAGDPGSRLTLECELRGAVPPLETPPVASRVGVDLAPGPDDEWLRACVFSDQKARLERLDAALAIAREHPPPLVQGDALELLPELISAAPAGSQVIVFHTAVTAYMPEGAPAKLRELTQEVTYVTAEYGGGDGRGFQLEVNGEVLGQAHPHAAWLDWRA
jgi:hypothetical protein